MVRTNPDAMTAQEAAAWNESGADEMFRQSFEESMQAQEAAQARDMQRDTLKANLTNQLTATNRYTPEQAAVNAELAAAGYAAMAQRSGMSIDELYGMMPLNVVSDGLTGAGFDQALASNPPRGWVHAQDGAAAADLWNGNGQAQAVFWTGDNPKLAEQFPELAGYSVSVDKFAVEHIRKNHGDFEQVFRRGVNGHVGVVTTQRDKAFGCPDEDTKITLVVFDMVCKQFRFGMGNAFRIVVDKQT